MLISVAEIARGVLSSSKRNGRDAREELFEAIVGGEAEPGRCPTPEIGEFGFVRDSFHLFERRAGTVSGADERADTRARDHIDGNARFAKNPQDADVRDAAGESAGEGQADARASRALWRAAIGKGAEHFLGRAQQALRVTVLFTSHDPPF